VPGNAASTLFRFLVFERYYRELLGFLARKVRDRDVAADLAQESFARVYAAERSGSVVHDPRALLYRTARNLLVDSYRRAEVRAPEGDAELGMVEPDMYAGPDALEPEAALNARQRFEALADTVDRLPTRCREAFILVKFDGLTHAQTAERMGISVKTVEMQIQIALQACREKMAHLDGTITAPRAPRGRPKKDKTE
jgi:RNA polymerase sigma factor (sigma-70 family)